MDLTRINHTGSACNYSSKKAMVEKGRVVNVIYLDSRKAFCAVFHSILICKLRNFGLDDWSVKEAENWLTTRLKWPTSALVSEYPGVHRGCLR